MDPRPPRVRTLTLAREEIRALPRHGFGMGALAAVLLLLAPIATLAMEGTEAVRDMLLFFWLVAMLVVSILLAARVAAARRSRFVDSLYTTPLQPRTWLAAQALVGFFLAGLVMLAQVPFLLVHVALIGVPPALPAMLAAALGMAAFAVALGLFCGVVVGDAGPGAAGGLAGGLVFLSFVLLLVHGVVLTAPPTAAQSMLLRLTALSPLTLVVNAMQVSPFGMQADEPWRGLAGLAGLVAGLGGAAWVAYTRAQGPLGWEPRRARWAVAALVALAVVAPVASAAVGFREAEEEDSFVFAHGERTQVAFVPRGAPITDEAFTWQAVYDRDELVLGEDRDLDVLVLILAPDDASIRNVRVDVGTDDALRVVGVGSRVIPSGAPDGSARAGEGFEEESTGPLRPVYRVPVTLRPLEAEALRDSPVLVTVSTTFAADGRAYESHARMTLDVNVPHASTALLLSGMPLPVAALATLATRKLRTR